MAGHNLPDKPIRDAMFTAIDAATAVDVFKTRVPENTVMPYIYIGEFTGVPLTDKSTWGTESTVTIHCYSSRNTNDECLDLMDTVLQAVTDNNPLAVSGFNSMLFILDSANTLRELEEEAWHGVLIVRILTTGNAR